MEGAELLEGIDTNLPDHTQLPDKDGTFVTNSQEHPQSRLLTDTLEPILQRLHPDRDYFIGRDCGVYWDPNADPPLQGCKAPDWYYVPGVPPDLGGVVRRSYVLWRELVPPLLVVEYVSGGGREERDRTPGSGKFWVYERRIRAWYYAIYEVNPGRVEVYRLTDGVYETVPPNERGHFRIAPLAAELGIWPGGFETLTLPWLRWWDDHGNLLPTSADRAERERQSKEQALQRADQERQSKEQALQRADQERQSKEQAQRRADRLAEKLRALGVNPDDV